VLRWFLDDTRMSALARDNGVAVSTAYDYRDEGIAVVAARKPSPHGALLAAKTAGHAHVIVDGTPIHTDRISTPGPTPGVDLWWSGKHHHHGGNIQVVSAPDGWPLWTSDVRPGRGHDTSAALADPDTYWPGSPTGSATAPSPWRIWATKASPRRSSFRSRSPKLGTSPSTSRLTTRSTAPCAAWVNAPIRCSRRRTRPCVATAAAPGHHRRSRPGPAPPRTRPHHMINKVDHTTPRTLRGKPH
jgi:hypothetical protein